MKKYLTPVLVVLLGIVTGTAQLVISDTNTVNQRLNLGTLAFIAMNGSTVNCMDPNNGDSILFSIDVSDPSFEVPNLLSVGGPLNALGPVQFSSAFVSHITHPTTNNYLTTFKDLTIVAPTGTNRTIVLLPGWDGRVITIKDNGTAANSPLIIRDYHGEWIDGGASLVLTNDYASVTLIYDYTNVRWWRIQ